MSAFQLSPNCTRYLLPNNQDLKVSLHPLMLHNTLYPLFLLTVDSMITFLKLGAHHLQLHAELVPLIHYNPSCSDCSLMPGWHWLGSDTVSLACPAPIHMWKVYKVLVHMSHTHNLPTLFKKV